MMARVWLTSCPYRISVLNVGYRYRVEVEIDVGVDVDVGVDTGDDVDVNIGYRCHYRINEIGVNIGYRISISDRCRR